MTAQIAIFAPMSNLRDRQLAWLENIETTSGKTLTEIARAAGLAPSTLTRYKNSNRHGHTLTASTVKRIEDATGIPAYDSRGKAQVIAFSEEEGAQFQPPANDDGVLLEALRYAASKSNSIDLWTLKTPLLTGVGYRQGDVVAVDRDAEPRVGDAVLAQRYDWRRGTAETIFRIYRTPYLLTAPGHGDPATPELVDNENIVIRGVIMGGFHLRAA